MNIPQYKYSFILGLILLTTLTSNGQKTISLAEATALALKNYPKLKQQDLYIQQQKSLGSSAKGHPAMALGYSWEEVGLSPNQGIHSIYAQQSFNLPSVAKARQALQEQKAKNGALQKELTKQQLISWVAISYQQILHTKSKEKTHQKLLRIYKEFERVAQKKVNVGETGKLPLLAAQTAISQLEAKIAQNNRELPIQLTQLHHWLLDESISDITDSALVMLSLDTTSHAIAQHPSVQLLEQNIDIQKAQKKVYQSQLSPQISTGLQLQIVNGQVPFFGGQLGLNVPLFNKGTKTKMQAVDLGIEIQKEQIAWQEKELSHHRHQLKLQIEQQLEQLQRLEKDILPKLQEQVDLSAKAYQLGEIDYQHFLQHARDLATIEYDYLDQLLSLNIRILDYKYLLE